MDEPALTEAVQTDLPSPKPTRQKTRKGPYGRLALRFAVLAAGASVLFAAYWFTRPSELVWWRSQPIGRSNRRVVLLIPNGWRFDPAGSRNRNADSFSLFELIPVDRRPKFLKWLLPAHEQFAVLAVTASRPSIHSTSQVGYKPTLQPVEVTRSKIVHGFFVEAKYYRTDRREFNRTYRRICDSLTIK